MGQDFSMEVCGNLVNVVEPETTTTDEESGDTEVIASSRLAPAPKTPPTCKEEEKPLRPFKRILVFVVLIAIAFVLLGVTAHFIYQKLNDSNNGEGITYGETITRPSDDDTDIVEDSGVLPQPTLQDQSESEAELEAPTDETESWAYSYSQDDPMAAGDETQNEDSDAQKYNETIRPKLPFEDIDLPFFDSSLTEGYANETDFEKSMTEAAKFLVNKVVLQNLESSVGSISSSGGVNWGVNSMLSSDANNERWRGTTTQASDEPQGFYDVTDYETNNQEHGIDEADVMKADENYVYAAYSDYVLVWDKYGNTVAQAKMPGTEEEEEGSISERSGGVLSGRRPHIESLLLVDDYLVVIVSRYNSGEGTEGRNLLVNYLGTQIRTYRTSSIAVDGTLTLVGTKAVHGRFLDAQSAGTQAHIATISSIDTYTYLMAPFERVTNYPGLDDEEYVKQVRQQASENNIPKFVEKLKSELLYRDSSGEQVLPNMLRVSQWQAAVNLTDSESMKSFDKVNEHMFTGGVINSVALITSFDVTAAPKVDSSRLSHELLTTTSALLSPSQHAHLYGTSSKLVLATQAWSWNSQLNASEQVTHLVVLSMDAPSGYEETVATSFHSVGTVRGYVLNPYSIDILEDRLRVATTIARRWFFQGQSQLSNSTVEVGNTHGVNVSDRTAESEEELVAERSVTENYITVLELGNDLQEQGVAQIGEQNEVIMAVRFFDDVAYCMTFEQTDPFYVVDMDSVEVLGSFKLNGFSNYLHPINDDNTLLVGIGQNVSGDGDVSGFMITVFNATDPTRPEAVVSYTVDDSPPESGETTQSTAQWDYKSYRYVDGKLIVPLDVVAYTTEGSTADAIRQTILGTFEGFVIFNVSPEGISEHFRVSHTTLACHYCGYLAPRSFVYDGNVMTAEGNIVSSANLYDKEEQWAFHVRVGGEEARCCY